MTQLSADKIACERAGRTVFKNVSFCVAAGEGMILTGPNGSGKTSLLRLVAGLLKPSAGRFVLEGGDDDLAIGQYCHYVGHLDGLKHAFSVQENLEFWAQYMGGGDVEPALDLFNLAGLCDLPAGILSEGQKRRLSLSRLHLVRRPIWLLDEPSVSLDRQTVELLGDVIDEHIASGGIVLASSHADMGIKFPHALDLDQAGLAR